MPLTYLVRVLQDYHCSINMCLISNAMLETKLGSRATLLYFQKLQYSVAMGCLGLKLNEQFFLEQTIQLNITLRFWNLFLPFPCNCFISVDKWYCAYYTDKCVSKPPNWTWRGPIDEKENKKVVKTGKEKNEESRKSRRKINSFQWKILYMLLEYYLEMC